MDGAKPTKQLLVANAATYIAFILVNGATQSGLFGDDNATISARYPTPLTPAGWAFSIWGVIFLLQARLAAECRPNAGNCMHSCALLRFPAQYWTCCIVHGLHLYCACMSLASAVLRKLAA